MAKLKEDFYAVPNGEIYPRWFRAGDDVTGEVEAAARSCNLIVSNEPVVKRGRPRKANFDNKASKAPENK